MFTSENVLSAEFINENSIKVTHKDSDNVLVTTIQKNPRKESYKSLISSGWTLKRIKERTKELQKIEDPNVRKLEVITNGYSWALDQLKEKRQQLADLYAEINSAAHNLENLYSEQKDVMSNLQDLYQEQEQAARTLNDLYSESKDAQQNLSELYDEQKTATGTLKELYNEHETAQNHLAELYTEKEVAEIRMKESQKDVDVRMQKLRDKLERTQKSNKDKLQKHYEQYQELYGMNITDSLLNDDKNFDKELVFKLKLEILADERFKSKSKEIKSQIRKSKNCRQLMKIAIEALEE